MKRYKILGMMASLGVALCTQSCLDFDEPIDDFRATDVVLEEEILKGNADSIDYVTQYTAEQVDSAKKHLSKYLGQLRGAQFYLCGGKEGQLPPHSYQFQNTLAFAYAQYGVVPHQDFAFAPELLSTYNVSGSWNNGANGQYGSTRNSLTPLLNHAAVDTIPEIKAMVLLMFDHATIQVADLYGPVPYSDFKDNKESAVLKYNDMRSIYLSVEANVDTIVKCFRAYEKRSPEYKSKIQSLKRAYDLMTQDKVNSMEGFETWIRFANSLKLRMAMHMVKIEPELAKKWAEEAVADGVIDDSKYEIGMSPKDVVTRIHPLCGLFQWGDMRLSASFESLMNSLQHPYKDMLFKKNSGDLMNGNEVTMPANSKVVGIRSGVHTGKGQAYEVNQFIGFSTIDSDVFQFAPVYLFKWAEIDFLRAEGALRGWNMGGTAKFFYERGIRNSSFYEPGSEEERGFAALLEKYMDTEQPREYKYVDPTGSSPDIQSTTKIGVKWNEGDANELKLEKIITQKYIALFPNCFEAWGEMRRTGYPKLFPVLNTQDGDGSLKEGDLVRRMLFPNDDEASLKAIRETGLKALGGADLQGTRIWWDVDKPNF
ncbi:MAG: SusD/RagB family nutrient-binding outer membrane lipoprotein [Prevotellaceae bacterium]|nr:SusD/RagB family nutrient-binding outer membrane lipoprotein [Prevotella sp.]MDD7257822.1 SusD/RagB family nutrient-binding outer membrane lipoprotein [Prevotellaceae bacterium]MDY6131611.1 SusD/RagB family nutrient-binding outer membrane lipoprotein [Prevotella sp.]